MGLECGCEQFSLFLWLHLGSVYSCRQVSAILKIGFGPAVYYTDMSVKLNLCSQYKITVSEKGRTNHGGECVGKTEIDSASISKWGWIFPAYQYTLWEIFTKDSIWKILSWTNAQINNDLKLKNHNDLGYTISSGTEIHISYTYRF